jgi:hypothetical protein
MHLQFEPVSMAGSDMGRIEGSPVGLIISSIAVGFG